MKKKLYSNSFLLSMYIIMGPAIGILWAGIMIKLTQYMYFEGYEGWVVLTFVIIVANVSAIPWIVWYIFMKSRIRKAEQRVIDDFISEMELWLILNEPTEMGIELYKKVGALRQSCLERYK